MINFPPFSLVPTSEPSLRLFAKKVPVQRLELPKRFDNNFIARLAQVTENSVIPLTETWPPLHPSPPTPSPPQNDKAWPRPEATTCKIIMPSCISSYGLKKAAGAMYPWMTPWPHKSCLTYLSDCRARKIWHTRPGVCCHYCTTLTSFVFYYLKLSLYQSLTAFLRSWSTPRTHTYIPEQRWDLLWSRPVKRVAWRASSPWRLSWTRVLGRFKPLCR